MSRRRVLSLLVASSLVVGGAAALAPAAHAAPSVRTWDGVRDDGTASADASWSTAANWVGDVAPVPGDSLQFPQVGSARTPTNDFPAYTSFGGIDILPTPIGHNDFRLTGNPIVLSSKLSGRLFRNLIELEIRLGSDVTVTSDGEMNLLGRVDLAGHSLRFAGSGRTTVLGSIVGAGASPAAIVVAGSTERTLVIDGDPRYSGALRIDSGGFDNQVWAPPEDAYRPALPGPVLLNGGTFASSGRVDGPVIALAGGGVYLAVSYRTEVKGLSLNPATLFTNDSSPTRVVGTVNLGGARLDPASMTCIPCTSGTVRTLIDNDGDDPVVGTFAGLGDQARYQRNGQFFELTYGSRITPYGVNDVNIRAVDSLAPDAPVAPSPRSGYWMLSANGEVFVFGDAVRYGNAGTPAGDAVDIEATPDNLGYWVVTSGGQVHRFGTAGDFGSPSGLPAGETVTALSRTQTGKGYWLFTDRGRVLRFGDAVHYGDMSAARLNGPVLDSIPTASGRGYFMVASDGGIFAFGDAVFRGSTGNIKLNQPVQSLVPDGDGVGYWLVASDGGIFAFDAPFRGSTGNLRLNKPVTGMVRYGDGYMMVAEDGGIFNFSSKPFVGSLGATPPAAPIRSVTATG